MIRIDAIKYEVSQMDLGRYLLPGEPHILLIPEVLTGHPVVKRPTDQEIYALRSAILVGEVLPALYGKLEVDFVRTGADPHSRRSQVPALQLTYIPEGIQDARVSVRVATSAAFPDCIKAMVRDAASRAELACALWEKHWPVRLIAQEFGCSKTLIRRDIDRTAVDNAVVAGYIAQIPQAPLTFTRSQRGIYARDRDAEFEFRKAIGAEQLHDFKARVQRYAAMCLDGSRADMKTQLLAAQLWNDVDVVLRETGVSAARFSVELGYTTSGMRNAIARMKNFTAVDEGACS